MLICRVNNPIGNNYPPQGGFLEWTLTRFVLAVACFYQLRRVNPSLFIRYLSFFSPFIIFGNFVFANPFDLSQGRFVGFYGDPNYLAMALNIIIALNYLYMKDSQSKILKIISFITIIGAIVLILLGISRGGIIGMLIVLLSILMDAYRQHRLVVLVTLFTLILSSGTIAVTFGEEISNIQQRFTNLRHGNDRTDQFQSAINVLENQPLLLVFGIGIGNNGVAHETYKAEGYESDEILHHTFFRVLFEEGLISFVVFILLFVKLWRRLLTYKNRILIGLFLATILSSMTVSCISFMPFWIVVFYLSNIQYNKPCYYRSRIPPNTS